mmetsp:Transcript_23972/g.47080  ORF Transcript_23972/g.47080 Transcript_23972/m.47080 type:complete len:210 (-) Transcript_23972:467-1096(-)
MPTAADQPKSCSDYTALKNATVDDINLMAECYKVVCSPQKLADRLLDMLKAQKGEEFKLGQPIDLYTHGLQTATRAMRDGADEETIVACLLHDIGELQCPHNHGDVIASLLRPYISPDTWWVLANHEVFQGYYYFQHVGGNKNSRDVYKDHPCFQKCADFCEKWDQCSFDPNFECEPLETFAPLVLSVVSREPFWWDKEHPKRGAVTGV